MSQLVDQVVAVVEHGALESNISAFCYDASGVLASIIPIADDENPSDLISHGRTIYSINIDGDMVRACLHHPSRCTVTDFSLSEAKAGALGDLRFAGVA